MWDDFGPINLEVRVPQGVSLRASAACERTATETRELPAGARYFAPEDGEVQYDVYRADLQERTGELFLALDGGTWEKYAEGEKEVALGRAGG